MDTLVIRLIQPATINLLKQLEELKLLEVINPSSSDELSLSEKYAGKLPKDFADELNNHVEKSRSEWKESF